MLNDFGNLLTDCIFFSVRVLIMKFQQTFEVEIGGTSFAIIFQNEVNQKYRPFHTEASGKEMENKFFAFEKFRKIIDTE